VSRNTSVVLGDHFAGFVDRQVESGRYATASEVVRAGLRLLEEQEAKLEALRRAIDDGDASGPAEPFDVDAYVADRRAGSGR
jgi:antitoxin ParD1/3/4